MLALPAVFVIVAVQLLDLPVAPAAIMAVLALIVACVVVLMSKPRTRPGLAAGERPPALVPLHSGRIAAYGLLAAPPAAPGVALPLFVPFVRHRPSPSPFHCPPTPTHPPQRPRLPHPPPPP